MFHGAFLLAICLATAGWVLWKQYGEHWWYLQQQRSAQAIEDMSNEDLHRLLGGKHLPSWINFPDFQRVQWVNDVIGQSQDTSGWPLMHNRLLECSLAAKHRLSIGYHYMSP